MASYSIKDYILHFLLFTYYGIVRRAEIIIRRLYYEVDFLRGWAAKYKSGSIRKPINLFDRSILFNQIDRSDLSKGDLVIVHASMNALAVFDVSPDEILQYLLSKIGDSGTLVMPTFPVYRKDPTDGLSVFDTNVKICTSGLLSGLLLRYPNVERSKFPHNNLSAIGPLAKEMMRNNLNSELSMGINSSWYFCKCNHAKILFLGVPAYKTTTMVHVAEDYLNNEWPIKNWFINEKIKIYCDGEITTRSIKIRNQFWSKFNLGYYRTFVFKHYKLLYEWKVEGVSFGIVEDSSLLVDFIIKRVFEKKLFFKVPKRYWNY